MRNHGQIVNHDGPSGQSSLLILFGQMEAHRVGTSVPQTIEDRRFVNDQGMAKSPVNCSASYNTQICPLSARELDNINITFPVS